MGIEGLENMKPEEGLSPNGDEPVKAWGDPELIAYSPPQDISLEVTDAKPQRMLVTLNVVADACDAAGVAFEKLCKVALDMSHEVESMTVSMYPYDDETMDQEEYVGDAVKVFDPTHPID